MLRIFLSFGGRGLERGSEADGCRSLFSQPATNQIESKKRVSKLMADGAKITKAKLRNKLVVRLKPVVAS
jgi:hypothetical protein